MKKDYWTRSNIGAGATGIIRSGTRAISNEEENEELSQAPMAESRGGGSAEEGASRSERHLLAGRLGWGEAHWSAYRAERTPPLFPKLNAGES